MRLILIFIILLIQTMSICTKPPKMPSNRMPSRPYISGDGFRAFADHVYDETDRTLQADEIAPGDIVFVRAAMLDAFFAHIHPNIVHRYILVSHNAYTNHLFPLIFLGALADTVLFFHANKHRLSSSCRLYKKVVPFVHNAYAGIAHQLLANHQQSIPANR